MAKDGPLSGAGPSLLSGGAAVLVSRTATQLSQFVIFILAARILGPAELGIFAIVSAIAYLLARAAEGGWREFILQWRGDSTALCQVMTAAILAGGAMMLVGLASAGFLGLVAGYRSSALLLALFSCWVLLAPVTAVHEGMLVRRGRVKTLAAVQLISEVAGFCVAVAALWAGAGIFALVFGKLAYQVIALGGMSSSTRWFPPFGMSAAFAHELIGFSKHILATRLLSFSRSYAATLSVGYFLGAASAGYYRAGERIVLALSEVAAETVRLMGWTIFRRAVERAEGDDLRQSLAREGNLLHPIVLAACAPVFVGLALVSGNLFEVVLGERWRPSALVASIIAVRQLLYVPCFLTEPLLVTAGEVRRLPFVTGLNTILSVSLIVVLAPFGIVAVALGQAAVALVILPCSLRLQQRYAGISIREVAVRSAFLVPAIGALSIAVLIIEQAGLASGLSSAMRLILQVTVGAAVYLAVLAGLQFFIPAERRLFDRSTLAYT